MTARIVCLAALGLAGFPGAASASCVASSEREQFGRADAVFVGGVVSVSANHASARFSVRRVRKGDVRKGSILRVSADPYPSSITIAWRPRRGQLWWLYAEHRGNRWTTRTATALAASSRQPESEDALAAHVVRADQPAHAGSLVRLGQPQPAAAGGLERSYAPAAITSVTKLSLASPTVPVTLQQPAVGKMIAVD